MAPDLVLVVAGITCAWAFFGIVGNERQNVIQTARTARKINPPEPSSPKPATPITPPAKAINPGAKKAK